MTVVDRNSRTEAEPPAGDNRGSDQAEYDGGDNEPSWIIKGPGEEGEDDQQRKGTDDGDRNERGEHPNREGTLVGPRLRRVDPMLTGGAETERRQQLR